MNTAIPIFAAIAAAIFATQWLTQGGLEARRERRRKYGAGHD